MPPLDLCWPSRFHGEGYLPSFYMFLAGSTVRGQQDVIPSICSAMYIHAPELFGRRRSAMDSYF